MKMSTSSPEYLPASIWACVYASPPQLGSMGFALNPFNFRVWPLADPALGSMGSNAGYDPAFMGGLSASSMKFAFALLALMPDEATGGRPPCRFKGLGLIL